MLGNEAWIPVSGDDRGRQRVNRVFALAIDAKAGHPPNAGTKPSGIQSFNKFLR